MAGISARARPMTTSGVRSGSGTGISWVRTYECPDTLRASCAGQDPGKERGRVKWRDCLVRHSRLGRVVLRPRYGNPGLLRARRAGDADPAPGSQRAGQERPEVSWKTEHRGGTMAGTANSE